MQTSQLSTALYTLFGLMQPHFDEAVLDYVEQAIRLMPEHPKAAAMHLMVASQAAGLNNDPGRTLPFVLIARAIHAQMQEPIAELLGSPVIELSS